MYLATIPDFSSDNEDDKKPADNNKNKGTGSFNMFDFDSR